MCTKINRGTAQATSQIDTAKGRVTKRRFTKRGKNTSRHKHANNYVVLSLFTDLSETNQHNDSRTAVQIHAGMPLLGQAEN